MFGAKYNRGEQIGQGAFGKAYKAIPKGGKGLNKYVYLDVNNHTVYLLGF